jgi:hypothetical protein
MPEKRRREQFGPRHPPDSLFTKCTSKFWVDRYFHSSQSPMLFASNIFNFGCFFSIARKFISGLLKTVWRSASIADGLPSPTAWFNPTLLPYRPTDSWNPVEIFNCKPMTATASKTVNFWQSCLMARLSERLILYVPTSLTDDFYSTSLFVLLTVS